MRLVKKLPLPLGLAFALPRGPRRVAPLGGGGGGRGLCLALALRLALGRRAHHGVLCGEERDDDAAVVARLAVYEHLTGLVPGRCRWPRVAGQVVRGRRPRVQASTRIARQTAGQPASGAVTMQTGRHGHGHKPGAGAGAGRKAASEWNSETMETIAKEREQHRGGRAGLTTHMPSLLSSVNLPAMVNPAGWPAVQTRARRATSQQVAERGRAWPKGGGEEGGAVLATRA